MAHPRRATWNAKYRTVGCKKDLCFHFRRYATRWIQFMELRDATGYVREVT